MTAPAREAAASDVLAAWFSQAFQRIRATRRRGVLFTAIGGALGVVVALALPLQFTSNASFIAQGSSASTLPGALQGIAASVGLANPKDYSPQFYADLVTSRPVLAAALKRRYTVGSADGGASKTYVEIERITGADSAVRLDNGLRHLQRRVAARADVRTNIITVSVTARYATLSRDLAKALLEALDSMNISFRQEQSRELREFFETRVADAQHELDSAEAVLRHFLERNRATQNSPLLQFEQLRLTRTADLKRAVYTTVVEQYEGAKMQEARNVPVLTVLMPPTAPTRKSGPPRRFIVVLGLFLGLVTALAWGELHSRWPSRVP